MKQIELRRTGLALSGAIISVCVGYSKNKMFHV